MDLRRRSVALRFIFLACLVGLGWWLRPDETPTAPTNPVQSSLPEQASPRLPAVEAASHETTAESSGPALATFKGRVVDADTREPIREFELKFVGAQQTKVRIEAPGARKFNTDDGRFEWQQLPAGAWTVTAEATGYQRFDLFGLQLTAGAATAEVVLPLRRGQILRGRIYDQASQAGIASASIGFREANTARFAGNWRMRPRVTSAKDGSFVLNGVPPGRITLEVSANEYASRELDVVVADDTAPLEIGLSTGGLIAGRLTGADGVTPIKGFAGLFRVGDFSGFSIPTGEAGEFSFRNLTPGRYRLTGQVASSNATREFDVADNERIEGVVLAVGAGRTIRGTVTGLRPAELKALTIRAQPEGQFSLGFDSAEINERGEYELRGVQPGRAQVVAEVIMRRQLSRTVDVPANADVTVNFDFPRGVRLSGRVTQRGEPIARTYLSPRPTVQGKDFTYGTPTSANGEYVLEDLAPGEYVIWVGQSFRSRPVQVSGDTVFDIDVPAAQLAGRVLEEGGNVPIVGAQVDLWSTEAAGPRMHLSDRADHFGQFGLAGLEPGDFMLVAHKAGYDMYRERIAYSTPIPEMKIELRRDAGVELRARDASGKSPPHVWASEVIGDGKGVMLQVNLDEQGVGYIPRALAGATIAFSAGGYTPLTVPAWNGKRLDLKLVRSTTTQ